MPTKPKRPCRYSGCPRLTDGVYCEEHAKLMKSHYEHFSRGYNSGERYDSVWRKTRNRYIAQHPLCEMCLKQGRMTPADEVHHIKPVSHGGGSEFSNLMSLCRSCHTKIHHDIGDR